MRPIVRFLLFVACLAVAADATARPRVGLVLSGGGARGAAHAGVLQVLEEHRIPVDVVAGTSFGALVGGLYASGLSPDEIAAWIRDFDHVHAASDRPPRRQLSFRRKLDDTSYALRLEVGIRDGGFVLPRGLIAAQELGFQLHVRALHAARWHDFDDFPIPFRAVATDIERAEPVVLGDGSLAHAMLASMAVPGIVAPVEHDGRLLVDGGLVNNLPVDVVRALGADIVIVVDVASPLASRDALDDVVGVSTQVINIIGMEQARAAIVSLGPDDVLVQPDLAGISASDFERMDDAVVRGAAAARAAAARLAPLALDEAAWGAWLAAHRAERQPLPVVDFIELRNPTGIADELVRARMTLRPGAQLTVKRLRRDVDALYSIGAFARVDFELVERDGARGLVVALTPKELGNDRLRFGLNIEDDFGGASAYNLLVMHDRTQLNRLGGEWRTEFQIGDTRRVAGQLFQPLGYRGDWFVAPRVDWSVSGFSLFDGTGNQLARYEVRRDALTLEVGWQWRNLGEIAVGRVQQSVRALVDIGDPTLPTYDRAQGGWDWHLTVDQLDDWNFPADAWFLSVNGRHTPGYARAEFQATGAWEFGDRNRLIVGARGGARTAGALPLHEQFSLGGFLSLSGLHRDELRGEYLLATRLLAYRRMFDLPTALGDGFYLGVSHERGNAWATRDAVSLGDLRWGVSGFLGADLVFGALYLGVGRADNGDIGGYLFLQRSFK